MSFSMHDASVPMFTRLLGNLLNWLDKAEAHAAARKFQADTLLTARLAPDMLPLVKQIQIATDSAKFAVARLAQQEAPKVADDETTIAQLRERVRRTIDFVQSVPADRYDGAAERTVTVPLRGEPVVMSGADYLTKFALPNFFFHVTTTYALLRHNGVELGKADFLGKLG